MDLVITDISFRNFRSYESFDLHDVGDLTILIGPNAVGKTNVIEGIQLLTAISSFRHPAVDQLVRLGCSSSNLGIDVSDGNRKLNLSLRVTDRKKHYSLNGKAKRPSDLKGVVPSVTFTPDDLNLVKGSMSVRRSALDALGSQLSSNHYLIVRDYEKVLRYKNRLLKEEASDDLVASVDEMIATCGSQLVWYRSALFGKLIPFMVDYYHSLSNGVDSLSARYAPSWSDGGEGGRKDGGRAGNGVIDSRWGFSEMTGSLSRDEIREELTRALFSRRDEERRRRRALVGPHADRLEFFIDGKDAGVFGSQGQQRSIVLSWKLAEIALIGTILDQKPILLLDDVMSELDADRRGALVSYISGDIQTFITTTNLSYFDGSLLDDARIVELSSEDENREPPTFSGGVVS